MTSRGCTKSYNRKINSVITSNSIQFDKLFRENSNRPSAAKSAGTVGKWGITSFTSIRSTNINGRRSIDGRNNYGTKRAKLDYGNQNADEKDIFSYNLNEESNLDVNKPKKFFKSRIITSTLEESRSVVEASYRDEGKPPIVLRICKGTARLVCSEEADHENYRILTTSPDPKIIINQKVNSQYSKPDIKPNRVTNCESPIITSVCTLDKSEMRTTRSRSKNLRLDVSPSTVNSLINSQNSGLSLTLRKSVTDANNTLVSHYDIVKTECTSTCSNKVNENLVNHDQLLPTTTQELIDILSNDVDHTQNKSFIDNKIITKIEQETNYEKDHLVKDTTQKIAFKNLEINSLDDVNKNEQKVNIETEQHIKHGSCKSDSLVINKDTKNAVKALEQDSYSSSDESESASGNLQSEIQSESPCVLSNSESSIISTKNINSKPTVIKKGSIFKTRSTGSTNGNKRRALYKHKWCDSDKELKSVNNDNSRINTPSTSCATLNDPNLVAFDEEFENASLTRIVTYPETGVDLSVDIESAVTSIRCGKKVKGFYTVVKNVKKAHQIQESGEFQEFNDDVEYILDTLRENNPNATRCLSAIRLASKCMAPAFRMHVRAHGTVAKFFKALHDATTDQSLALCTATVMFVLSQDRLAMDLDRDCLELMLSLLESDASHKNALDDCGLSYTELLKNKEKVRQLCADIQGQGHAKHLNLDNITVGQLAMETLLSLTSKRAGEWFKEELRELGGLEHIIKTITECHRHIKSSDISHTGWDEPLLDKLRKVDRCLRVLENVTHMNEENQVYLLKYNDSILVITLASLYNFCGEEILKYPTDDCSDKTSNGAVIRECLFAVVKVLINLTHRFNRQSVGGKTVGHQNKVIDNSLHLILRVPQFLPEEKQFDIMMLALILLINLIEQCEDNKKLLIMSKTFSANQGEETGLDALINLFYKQEELARVEEQKTDAILDGKKDCEQSEMVSTTSKSQEEFIEETVAKLLQKAGRHMEHTLIGAYVVLLLGYLVMDNKIYENLVRKRLPDDTFVTMVAVLQKFFNFMNLTASNEISSCGIAATEKVIKFLKMSDARLTDDNIDLKLVLEDVNITLDHSSS
ncbi:PREDICTED: protein wings apart-like isoform X2 [Ceratosolen solmsi marchali]|uniref:Protein wings apart-like isoform X2 n=1 Tax=Ceratosolen solmsi marchali TaxID=326594 RepID=A0AAJ7E2F4_9HYME|nr:PREDICTED: protein wings apart-like isoform X2 [Ceratosolen solmsi marchali]